MILILTVDEDEHADAVEAHLRSLQADYLRLDPAGFPSEATIGVRVRPGGTTWALSVEGRLYDLAGVGAVWLRRPGRPRASELISDASVRELISGDSETVLFDVLESLEVQHLPATDAVIRRAGLKLRQLLLAQRLGFLVPETALGNDPDEVRRLVETQRVVVTKRAVAGRLQPQPTLGGRAGRPTRSLRPRDLLSVDDVRLCPILAQGYVAKRLELRVTVVGEHVFAAAIDSQRSARTRHDFRHYDGRVTPMLAFDLPSDVVDRCRALVRALGLTYAALDLILTPSGDFVFVELNPNGQYLWTEDATGLPISMFVARELVLADSLHQTERAENIR